MPTEDLRELDRQAVRYSVELARRATPADLDRPTPCAGWSLGELLAHMTAQHRGFAAAAQGQGENLARWAQVPVDGSAVERYVAAADEVIDAFARLASLDERFALPEVSTDLTFSARRAIGFHLIDYVVHGWDVARALGLDYELTDELGRAALPIAQAVPDGDNRSGPGASFAPGRPAAADAAPLERILLLLGRSPAWLGG